MQRTVYGGLGCYSSASAALKISGLGKTATSAGIECIPLDNSQWDDGIFVKKIFAINTY